MVKTIRISALLLLVLLANCNNPKEQNLAEIQGVKSKSAEVQNRAAFSEQKLIREGYADFETKNIGSTKQNILKAIARHQAYIASDQESTETGRKVNSLVIRVPSANFDQLLADCTADAVKLDRKEINVSDVTEEFLDISARLKTKKELENRYLELLKQAKSVTEILEIEKQSGELRAEIESIEGRLKFLESQVSLSTLRLSFYETRPSRVGFGHEFENGFRNGWDNLIWFFVVLVNLWPFVFITVVAIFSIRIYKRRKGK